MVKTVKRTSRKRQSGAGPKSSSWIRKDRRLAIYLRDGFACLYCEADLRGVVAAANITLDHVKPCNSRFKKCHHESNVVTACRSCNCSRQDKPLAKFAGRAARARVARQTATDLAPFRKLARQILAGEIEPTTITL